MLDNYRNERRYNKQIKSSHRSLIFTNELHDILVLPSGKHVREMYTPYIYIYIYIKKKKKTWVCRDIHVPRISDPKHTLWVPSFERKYLKNKIHFIFNDIFIFSF